MLSVVQSRLQVGAPFRSKIRRGGSAEKHPLLTGLVIPQLGGALSPKAPFLGRLGETAPPKIEGLLGPKLSG